MDRLLELLLRRFVRRGTLRLTTARGSVFTVGDGTGQPVAMRFTTKAAQRGVLLDPEIKLGEAYMDGTLRVEEGSIADLLAIVLGQTTDGMPPDWARPQWTLALSPPAAAAVQSADAGATQCRPSLRSRRPALFAVPRCRPAILLRLFRDAGPVARRRPARQEAPSRRQAAARRAASACSTSAAAGAGLRSISRNSAASRVTGITLSREQWQRAAERAAERNLTGSVEFRMQDYRDLRERFDRIVSVGMFEHVGVGFYDAFFRKCAELLSDDGVMLLHSIGRSEGPNVTNPWIAKYIFPGGYIPALSEVLPAIERAGLLVTDIEILRLHYAETLRAWRERFLAHREEAERIYDQRFVRMWEFYLAASEMAFREQAMMVMQIQLTKRQDVVPITRDYIAREEARLRALEGGQRPPLRLAGE